MLFYCQLFRQNFIYLIILSFIIIRYPFRIITSLLVKIEMCVQISLKAWILNSDFQDRKPTSPIRQVMIWQLRKQWTLGMLPFEEQLFITVCSAKHVHYLLDVGDKFDVYLMLFFHLSVCSCSLSLSLSISLSLYIYIYQKIQNRW